MELPPNVISVFDSAPCIPQLTPAFVPFGNYDKIKKIIDRRKFFPIYVTGLSGNGKTLMVKQACAETGREYFRANITAETEESDLIGSWTLINGETKFQYGVVIEAMRRGGVLLLDEYDLGGVKTMCLQPVMEGESIFIKKINQWIHPTPGFTVIATANTKGRGEADRFFGAGIINEAALDRFKATIYHDYPDQTTEVQILRAHAPLYGLQKDDPIIPLLARWGASNRKTFAENGIDEVLTTRRLCAALETYSIFEDEKIAATMATERFSASDRDSLVKLLMTMVDEEAKKRKLAAEADAKRRAEEAKNGSPSKKSPLKKAVDDGDPF